ncbi:LEA type 2 family protein [Halopseudomonas salegens]|uniref:LEA14-like dessication related protein n=1 Tax=Halopseudomonas salegens TaxID=1434072 RepID=A0A1H2EL75_9GAMM|nr:LEA type 2 family protein [Halopseudomonas salegens]SDT95857.1 LEA14-like dessication related protein [Halopseudomonas salegens]
MPQRILVISLTMFGLMLLSGCAILNPGYSKPDIHLANVDMLKSNLWEQSFRLQLRIDNPNDRSLPIRGMHYQVYLNDIRLATGVSNNHFDVPAYGSEYFELNVRSNLWRHIVDIGKLVENRQPVTYRIEGHIRTGLFMARTITLRESGSLDPADLNL